MLDLSLIRTATRWIASGVAIVALTMTLLAYDIPRSAAEEASLGVTVTDLLVIPERTDSGDVEALTWSWSASAENLVSGYELRLGDSAASMIDRDSFYIGAATKQFSVPLPHVGGWCVEVRAIDQTLRAADSIKAGAWSGPVCYDNDPDVAGDSGIEADEVLSAEQDKVTLRVRGDAPRAPATAYEAEDFLDTGTVGEYFDTDASRNEAASGPGNIVYDQGNIVDIFEDPHAPEEASGMSGNQAIGRTRGGEFIQYDIDPGEGNYEFAVRVASGAESIGKLVMSVDGQTIGEVTPAAAGWWDWQRMTVGTKDLTAGSHRVRIQFTGPGNINFDRFEIAGSAVPFGENVIVVETDDDLQDLINRNPAGTTYEFQAGVTYRNVHDVVPKDDDKFVGDPGNRPTLDGSGRSRRSAFATEVAVNAESIDARIDQMRDAPVNVIISNLDFRNYAPGGETNNEPQDVKWARGVVHGQNYVAPYEDSNEVLQPETLTWPRALPEGNADFAHELGYGRNLNWQLSNIHIDNTRGVGVFVGSGFKLSQVDVTRSSDLGVGGSGTVDVDIQGGVIAENSYALRSRLWDHSGGLKITRSKNLTVNGVHVHDNHGPGLWLDIAMRNATVTNNRVVDNLTVGIYHEISFDGRIEANIVQRNAPFATSGDLNQHAGIYISTSNGLADAGLVVARNLVTGSPTGVLVYDARNDRAPHFAHIAKWLLPAGLNAYTGEYVTVENNAVCTSLNNGVLAKADGSASNVESSGSTYASTSFVDNTYYQTPGGPSFKPQDRDMAQWQAFSVVSGDSYSSDSCPTQVPQLAEAGFACVVSGDQISWTDAGESKYWVYQDQGADGAMDFQWIGRTSGDPAGTTFAIPDTSLGSKYQVHYQGIDRVDCSVAGPPVGPSPSAFACVVSGDQISWTDAGQSKYWIYRSTDGGTTYSWLGRTLGATNLDDPGAPPGALYQVRYSEAPVWAECAGT